MRFTTILLLTLVHFFSRAHAALPILINNVNVLDIERNQRLKNQQVLIIDGAIKQVSSNPVNPPENAIIVDGSDKFLMPGLIDMHVHVFEPADLFQLLSHGVTTARVMHGWPQVLDFREKVKKGELKGPELVVSSPIVNQQSPFANSNTHEFVETPDQAQRLVKSLKAKGYNLIKVYDGLRPEVFNRIANTANELNIPFAGHPSFYLSIDEFLQQRPQTIEHIEMLYQTELKYKQDAKKLRQLSRYLAEQNIPVTTTLVVFDNLARIALEKDDFLKGLPTEYMHPMHKMLEQDSVAYIKQLKDPQSWRDKADYLGHMAKVFSQNKVPMVLGSDGGVGYTINGKSTIDEMALLANYGVAVNEVLKMATVNPAKVLGKSRNLGKVAVDYRANLLLLERNPRQDLNTLRKPLAVIKDGELHGDKSLLRLDKRAKEHISWMQTAIYFFESL